MSVQIEQSPPSRSSDGVAVARRILDAVAVLAIVATVVALLLIQRIGTTYRDGLEATRDGAGVAVVSASSASQLADDVSALTDAAVTALEQTERLIGLASRSTADVGTALGTNLALGVEGTANIADGMAGFIEAIERLIPGDTRSLAEDLRALADGLDPVPEQLRALGEQLMTTSDELDSSIASLQAVAAQLSTVGASIDEAQAALAQVDTLATDVAVRAEGALDRSDSDMWLLRMLVTLIGVGVAAACAAAKRAITLVVNRPAAV